MWLADPGSISFLANEADQILSQRGSEQAFRRRGLARVDSDLDSAGYGFESESLIDGVRDRVGKVGDEYDVLGRPLLREGVVCSGCRDGGTVSVVNGAAGLQHYLAKLVSSHTRRTPGHAARAPHRRSGPVALCEEEPDHLGGRVGAHRVGEGPDRAPSVPRVPAATHRPGLSEDDAGDVGVHGAGSRRGQWCAHRGQGFGTCHPVGRHHPRRRPGTGRKRAPRRAQLQRRRSGPSGTQTGEPASSAQAASPTPGGGTRCTAPSSGT